MSEEKSKTAGPVDSCREQFEAWVSVDPYAKSIERYPDDPEKFAWPGAYTDVSTDLAWQAWQEAMEVKRTAMDARSELIKIAAACARFQHNYVDELEQDDLKQFGQYAHDLKKIADDLNPMSVSDQRVAKGHIDMNKNVDRESVRRSAHTPGPWKVPKRFEIYQDLGPNVGGSYIGTTAGNSVLPESIALVDEANARLMAAAPDLLVALQEVLDDGLKTNMAEWVSKANAAVKKACG